jgi:hypothetical protein
MAMNASGNPKKNVIAPLAIVRMTVQMIMVSVPRNITPVFQKKTYKKKLSQAFRN